MELEKLIALRRKLHVHAEVSGKEVQTNRILHDFLKMTSPDLLISKIGGYGLALVFKGQEKGKRLMLRADIDALPIQELNSFGYRSAKEGVSHKCGHDGHSTVLAGLAMRLAEHRPQKGEVVLLFQPAEETGEGAKRVIDDPLFAQMKPDMAVAWHNLPAFPLGSIVVRKGVFAAASVGLTIRLTGKTAHASQPETGKNPALALAELIGAFHQLNDSLKDEAAFSLITITHARLGEAAFGISPGDAECLLTVRSTDDDQLKKMQEQCVSIATLLAAKHQLSITYNWNEPFSSTLNDDNLTDCLIESAKENAFPLIELNEAFRWSEDFGQFGVVAPIALFGIGSGLDCPALHNPDYDFPDTLIGPGIAMLDSVCRKLLE